MERQQLGKLSLDQLADWMANISTGSPNDQMARAEFLRRQTLAEEESATAAKQTADYTKKNAKYLLWSVIVLAISSLGTLVASLLK